MKKILFSWYLLGVAISLQAASPDGSIQNLEQQLRAVNQQIAASEKTTKKDKNIQRYLSGLRFRKKTIKKQLIEAYEQQLDTINQQMAHAKKSSIKDANAQRYLSGLQLRKEKLEEHLSALQEE